MNSEKLQNIQHILNFATVCPQYTDTVIDMIENELGSYHTLTNLEIGAGVTKGKIHACKLHRERTGKSLMETKSLVETFFKNNELTFFRGKYE